MPDIEFAHTVLVIGSDLRDDAPILDLRVRKGVRRHGVKLLVASARPNALDPNAAVVARYAPGADEQLIAALHRGLDGEQNLGETIDGLVAQLRDGGEDVVIVYGERIGATAAAGAAASGAAAEPGASRCRAARDPRRRQRPRPARGRLRSRRVPRLRGLGRVGPLQRARSPARWPTAS